LVETEILNQSTPNYFYPQYQSALSRTLLRFCGTTFVETAVYGQTKFLSGIAITGTYASHVRLMCKTDQFYPYLLTSKQARKN